MVWEWASQITTPQNCQMTELREIDCIGLYAEAVLHDDRSKDGQRDRGLIVSFVLVIQRMHDIPEQHQALYDQ